MGLSPRYGTGLDCCQAGSGSSLTGDCLRRAPGRQALAFGAAFRRRAGLLQHRMYSRPPPSPAIMRSASVNGGTGPYAYHVYPWWGD